MTVEEEDQQHLWELLQQDPRSPNASSSLAYLDKLQATNLENVLKEPALALAEANRVETDLTNLCYREYPLFISVHQCSTAVRNAFDDFDHSLTRLLDSVPDLEAECRSFATSTQRLQSGRHRAGLLLEYQDKIDELLHMPKLMETCVRNGYYQDAIDISDHAQQLDQTSRLVQDVLIEISATRQLMMVQLVTLLRESIKLPTLIKTVSFIRRLGMDEAELRVVYLTSRLHNFNTHVGELDKSDPIRYIRRYIDLFREHIYDILTQFTAIFEHDLLLVSFANDSVTKLVKLVLDHLPVAGDSAALSSLLVQLGYCAISFSRLGLDFSSHFVEPFSGYILETYRQGVAKATEVLTTGLEQSLQSSASLSQHLVTSDFDPSTELEASADTLPSHVTQLPPLATFINAHLAALNVLRLLAPRHLARRLQTVQAEHLKSATESIFDYLEHAVANPVVSRERSTHRRSNSSPKAQLLRRNTETLLSPDERASKRRRSLQIYALFGRSWIISMRHLQTALTRDIFGIDSVPSISSLDEALVRTRTWVEEPVPQVNVNGMGSIARDLSGSFEPSSVAPPIAEGPLHVDEDNSVLAPDPTPGSSSTSQELPKHDNGRHEIKMPIEPITIGHGEVRPSSPDRNTSLPPPISPSVSPPAEMTSPSVILPPPTHTASSEEPKASPPTAMEGPAPDVPPPDLQDADLQSHDETPRKSALEARPDADTEHSAAESRVAENASLDEAVLALDTPRNTHPERGASETTPVDSVPDTETLENGKETAVALQEPSTDAGEEAPDEEQGGGAGTSENADEPLAGPPDETALPTSNASKKKKKRNKKR